MKVLVVEDDAATRRILGRLLGSAFGADVVEAENGMQALLTLESDVPDLVVTDVNMPALDGFGLLQALRASTVHADLPVVAVSASGEREQVTGLIKLGISEYLLKPLDLAAATKRLGRVIQEIRTRPKSARRRAENGNIRPRLLVADPDPNFREFFKSYLGGKYEVFECGSGPRALAMATEHQPNVVCVSDGLGLLNERLLTGHLRALASPPEAVYLLHADEAPADGGVFDGMVRKSFVPEVLHERWSAITSGNDLLASVAEAITGIGPEVISAAQQTFGVMTQLEVERLSDADAATVPVEVGMAARLVAADGRAAVTVMIHAARAEAERFAGAILGETMAWDEGANEAFGTLVETLAGRVRSSFDARAIKFEQQAVTAPGPEATAVEPAFRAGFKAPSGDRFVVAVTAPSGGR